MAEDNYLAAINAARQRTRGDVRRRIDQIIDPLDSAAQMDRMQGTSVMPTTGQVDPGAGNIMQLAGGRSAPVRTAVGGGSAPVQATAGRRGPIQRMFGGGGQTTVQSQGNCRIVNGQKVCGGGASAPFASDYEVSAPATTTVQKPASTTTQISPADMSSAGLIAQGLQQGDMATEERRAGTARVSSMHDRQADRQVEVGMHLGEVELREKELEEQKFVNREKAKTLAAAAALEYAQAGHTRDKFPAARFEDRAAKARDVFEGRASHNNYADFVVAQQAAAAGFSDETKDRKRSVDARPAIEDGRTLADVRKEALREIHTGTLVHGLMYANEGLKQIADTPGASLDALKLAQADTDTIGLRSAAAGIARSYHENGAFTGTLSQLEQNLRSDLNMLRGSVASYFQDERRNEADFAGLSPDRQADELDAARRRGFAAADSITRQVNDQMRAWWGQSKRGEFNELDPYSPKRRGAPPANNTHPYLRKPAAAATIDSNNTLADPPPEGIDSPPPARAKKMMAKTEGSST